MNNFLDYEQYIKQGEPDKSRNCYAWQTAIGLQAVDGLKPSDFLIDVAKKNIEGDISIDEVQNLIHSYYLRKEMRQHEEFEEEEADKVSVNIRKILTTEAFTFSVVEYLGIHGQIFDKVFKHAGRIRNYNITKKEWILEGETVLYSDADMIMRTLEYDFAQEKSFSYVGLSSDEIVKHFTRFIANIWQIHPFQEGNTRATAVFAIKYLHSLGFDVTNDIFSSNSWYFRNALVRANYSNVIKGISMDTSYLELFFRNLLLGERNALHNRKLHIKYEHPERNLPINLPINLSINNKDFKLLSYLKDKPNLTYDELSKLLNWTRETVRVHLRQLETQGLIQRQGSRKTGFWVVKSIR